MMTRLRLVGLLAAVTCLGASGCGAASEDSAGAASGEGGKGLVGKPAPEFTVATVVNGKGKVSLDSLHGKVVLLDFWGTFCEPCKKSFPKLQDLYTKYGDSGLRIVGVSE